jgi:hypothetical protein
MKEHERRRNRRPLVSVVNACSSGQLEKPRWRRRVLSFEVVLGQVRGSREQNREDDADADDEAPPPSLRRRWRSRRSRGFHGADTLQGSASFGSRPTGALAQLAEAVPESLLTAPWRKGIRRGFKILGPKGRPGSNPGGATATALGFGVASLRGWATGYRLQRLQRRDAALASLERGDRSGVENRARRQTTRQDDERSGSMLS